MTLGERYIRQFTESIEIKYLRAIERGWTDTAIILDVRDQQAQRYSAGNQRGSDIDPSILVGSVASGDRMALVGRLNELFPPNPAIDALANEAPPEGMFPVIVITDEEGIAKLYFGFFRKPD